MGWIEWSKVTDHPSEIDPSSNTAVIKFTPEAMNKLAPMWIAIAEVEKATGQLSPPQLEALRDLAMTAWSAKKKLGLT